MLLRGNLLRREEGARNSQGRLIALGRVEPSRVICAAKSSFTKLAPLRILV